MSKQSKKPRVINEANSAIDPIDAIEAVENNADNGVDSTSEIQNLEQQEPEQAEDNKMATQKAKEKEVEKQPEPKAKSGGKAIALLALLVALGVGGVGHYLANQKFSQVEAEIAKLANKPVVQQNAVEMPNFDAEKAQIAKLTSDYQQALDKVAQLEREQAVYTQQINQLQQKIQKLGSGSKADQSEWLLSDADFLLNNALRKVVLDNDIDTARSLLIEGDNVLSRIADQRVIAVRDAIKKDLNQLSSVNEVDQNNLMQRLAQLANLVDDMPLAADSTMAEKESGEVSDSIEDWQKNIEKSADSFLNHFIRVSDKSAVKEKAFIAPNQEVYLRENIRLRLQIAILTIPRQQNELYKQSLEAVSSWVRSYFDVKNDNVKTFLSEADDLIEKSIYIDAPNQLQSLSLLNQLLNKAPKPISKIQIEEEKSLEELKPAEPKAEDGKTPAMEEKAPEVKPQSEATPPASQPTAQ
ncbi:HemX protein [Pasteurellaceae bacterium Macca]|nr:HemX protein [Pasteurellaceae bacterium Macca]